MTLGNESAAVAMPSSPFEAVRISPELDGRAGTNRAMGNRPQIAAATDVDAITAWLARFVDSPNTFANYRKEAERLLLWSTVTVQKPRSEEHTSELQSLMRISYAVFCLKKKKPSK